MPTGEPYSGLFGAYRYAFGQSDSWIFRAYVATSALVGGFTAFILALGVVAWAATPGLLGEKALLGVIGVLVLAPLFAPVLIVARRYRLGLDRAGSDRLLALSGVGFLVSIALALIVSDPDPDVGGVPPPLDGAVEGLNAFPPTYGLIPPLVAVLGIYLAVRYTRPRADDEPEGSR